MRQLVMTKSSFSTSVMSHENLVITIRQANPNDAIGMSNCNKANLQEFYSDTLCNQFISKWPSLCLVAVAKSANSPYDDENVIGYALGRAVDVNLASVPQNMTQTVGTLGVELTYDNMVRAWNSLTESSPRQNINSGRHNGIGSVLNAG